MAWPKGKPRPATWGRKKGTPNKKTDLFGICAEVGLDVFKEMVTIAAKTLDDGERFSRLKELAPYLHAKKKEVLNLNDYTPEELVRAAEEQIENANGADSQDQSQKHHTV